MRVLMATFALALAQLPALRQPIALEPIPAIADAFRSHDVVAMSDGREHGDVQFHAFLLALVRDSRITASVNDIVLECCSARYQDVVDRFTSGGRVDEKQLAATLISTLEQATGTRAFTVWFPHDLAAIEPAAASWAVPSLAIVTGTRLGTIDFARFVTNALPRIRMRDGKPDFASGPIPRNQWRTLPMEQQFDAVMHLGPASSLTFAPLNPDVCTDTDFIPILRRRMAIVGLKPELDRLDRFCAGR